MIGNNALHLNEATIMEALQEWLDRRMPTENQLITSVSLERTGSSNTFVVALCQKEIK